MLQEWWGITEEIKVQAERLASHGFRVLLPDLYKGKLGLDAEVSLWASFHISVCFVFGVGGYAYSFTH